MSEQSAEKDAPRHDCDTGHFDRTLCGCGAMHSYCSTCDRRADDCSLDEDPPQFAERDVALTEQELMALEGAVASHRISVQQVVEAIITRRVAGLLDEIEAVESLNDLSLMHAGKWKDRAERAEAALARVSDLADAMGRPHQPFGWDYRNITKQIRAALDTTVIPPEASQR